MKEANFLDNAIQQTTRTTPITKAEFLEPYQEVDWVEEFIQDESRQIMMTGGRRGCKTTSCAAKMGWTNLFLGEGVTDANIFYAGKTFDHAMDLSWEKLRGIKNYFGLSDWNMNNESGGKIITPRSNIKILGFNDMDALAKAMGMPFLLFILDECQEYRDDILKSVVRDGASWGTFDNTGTLVLCGNPSKKKHTFYSQEWLHNNVVKKYHTNIFKNPMKTTLEKEEFLQEQRELRGLEKGNEDAEFKRMAYGEWVFDKSDQIFSPTHKNYYNELPEGAYDWIIGVDFGWSAYDAIAVLAYTKTTPKEKGKVYLVEEFQQKRQSFNQIADRVHELAFKYGVREIILDSGALAVKAIPDFIQRYSQYDWIASEKTQKMTWIEALKVEMNLGNFQMKKNCIFDKEIPLIEYSEDGQGLNEKLHHSDMLMAIAYPFRYIYNFLNKTEQVQTNEDYKERLQKDLNQEDDWEFSNNEDFNDWEEAADY